MFRAPLGKLRAAAVAAGEDAPATHRTLLVSLLGLALMLLGACTFGVDHPRAAAPQPTVTPTVHVGQDQAGSGDGSSCANARPAAFFNAASSWGPGKPIGPGAIVGLCGTITEPLVAQGSGSSDSPITIYFTPGAKLSEPVCGPCLTLSNRSYITVDGGANGIIEATDNGTTLGHQWNSTGILAAPCDHCVIKNLRIQNIYVHSGSGNEIDQTQVRAIYATGSNILIDRNTVHDTGWAVYLTMNNGDHDNRISNNDLYNVDHGITTSFGFAGGSVGPIFVNNNHFHDFQNWDTSNNAYHHDGIHCYTVAGGAGAHITDYYIYNNRFDGDIGGNATAWIFTEGGSGAGRTPCADSTSNIWVFNNFAVLSRDLNNGAFGLFSGVNKVYNNTLVGHGTTAGSVCQVATAPGAAFQNNVCMAGNQVIGMDPTSFQPGSPDYNVYADGGGNAFVCSGNFYNFSQFSNWQSCIGGDSHSVRVPDAKLNPDGRPQPGSPVLGRGANLTSLCTGNLVPLCYDSAGAFRPVRLEPDVGAYQAETAAVTGASVGNAQIGASQESVEKLYGQRRSVTSRRPVFGLFDLPGVATASYRVHRGVLAVSYLGGRVVAVTTTSPYYSTVEGFGVGAAADAKKLAATGWRSCGRAWVRRRGALVTTVGVARGRLTALGLSRATNLRCPPPEGKR